MLEERGQDAVRALLVTAAEGNPGALLFRSGPSEIRRGYAEAWLRERSDEAAAQARRTELYALGALIATGIGLLISLGAWLWPRG